MQGGWQPGLGPTQPSFGNQPYGYGGAAVPQYASAFGQYEFNEHENAIIAKTASRAKIWGIISIVVGALYLLSALFFILSPLLLMNLAPGIGGIILGITFLGVGNSLQNVVQTQGNDIEHMMQATEKLGTTFLTQIILTIVQAVLYALLALLAIFVFAVLFSSGGFPGP